MKSGGIPSVSYHRPHSVYKPRLHTRAFFFKIDFSCSTIEAFKRRYKTSFHRSDIKYASPLITVILLVAKIYILV